MDLLTRANETWGWATLFDIVEGQTKVQLTGPQLAIRFGVILRKAWGGQDFLSQLLRGRPAALALPRELPRPFRLLPPIGRGRMLAADTHLPEARAWHGPSRLRPSHAPPGRTRSTDPGRVGLTRWPG